MVRRGVAWRYPTLGSGPPDERARDSGGRLSSIDQPGRLTSRTLRLRHWALIP